MTTNLLPRPKTQADAHNEFLRATGDPRQLNRILAWALLGAIVAMVLMGLVFRRVSAQQKERIVIRIDDVGRAQAVGFTSLGYKIQPVEVKYFLGVFVHDYFGRSRVTIRDDFQRSMMFLNAPLAAARMADERTSKSVEKFLTGSDDEIAIQVNNIVLSELAVAPYTAQVDLTKVYRDRNGIESRRARYVDTISFTTSPDVSNAAILVNPLGFTVLSLREDQAF